MDPPTDHQHHHHHLHHQGIKGIMSSSDETLESMVECRKSQQQEKKAKGSEETLKCPRCDSINTKFCYYNNYSLTQPRYFCKSCRRYWTKGGTLRNVPVGGGCRKNNNKRPSSSSKKGQDQAMMISSSNPNNYDSINLAISMLHQNQNQNQNQMIEQGFGGELGFPILGNNNLNNNLQDDVFGGYFENPSINGYYNHQLFGGNIGHNENSGLIRNLGLVNGSGEEMGISSMAAYGDHQEMKGGNCGTAATTIVKQENMCNNNSENRMLMVGFPWQFGGDQTGNMVDFEPVVKQNWTGFGSWQGLLNSPLM